MKIAVATWTRRRYGGVETYLRKLVPGLLEHGHRVAVFHEVDQPLQSPPIPLPESVPSWCVSDLGADRTVSALRRWGPDLIFVNRLNDPVMEGRLLDVAPSVLFAHDYQGSCISGLKTLQWPWPRPCGRPFGPGCLALYFPRHCGGWDPRAMVSLYRLQSRRRSVINRYAAVVTYSEHMRREVISLGVPQERVFCVSRVSPERGVVANDGTDSAIDVSVTGERAPRPTRLLFMGRMEALKGGSVLIRALELAMEGVREPLEVLFAGEGRSREHWEERAHALARRFPILRPSFLGWVSEADHAKLFSSVDLLVLPSVWPEPFGQVGLEAGAHGVPAVAFAVGGIPEWLHDGRNGYLAPGDPPTARGLADAILRFLRGSADRRRLSEGAREQARRLSVQAHLPALLSVLSAVVEREAVSAQGCDAK